MTFYTSFEYALSCPMQLYGDRQIRLIGATGVLRNG